MISVDAPQLLPDSTRTLEEPSSEQLWDWSKDEIANRIFPSLDSLKLTLRELFLLKPKAFFSSLTKREFILDALQKIGMVPATI